MNHRAVQMLSKTGFTALFWTDLARARSGNPKITHQQVYEAMETEYKAEFNQRRYANFNSFLRRRDEK